METKKAKSSNAKVVVATNESNVKGMSDLREIIDIRNSMNKERDLLIGMGLSVDEVDLILKKRANRSNNVSLRLSDKELNALNVIQNILLDRGYVNDSRTDVIVYLMSCFVVPPKKQLEVDFNGVS